MTPTRMDRLESGVRTVLAFREAFNRHELLSMLRLIGDDCVFEPASQNDDPVSGKPSISHYWEKFFTSFPQAHLKVEEAFGFGMRCILRRSCVVLMLLGAPIICEGLTSSASRMG